MRILTPALALFALLLLAAPAFAQDKFDGPCKADAQTYCKDVKPGKGRVARCMAQHRDKLSQACKDHLKGELTAIQTACKADIDAYCKAVKPGQGRIAKCLKDNQAKVSQTCKEAIKR